MNRKDTCRVEISYLLEPADNGGFRGFFVYLSDALLPIMV